MTLSRYSSQSVLFAHIPSRRQLLDVQMPDDADKIISVNVWRNHAFETVMALMEPYCLYGNWKAKFNLGPYDDSLMFHDPGLADVELVWLDSSRFIDRADFSEWSLWLEGRLKYLRTISKAPVVLTTWTADDRQNIQLQKLVEKIPATFFADMRVSCTEASVELMDLRSASFSGTPVGSLAQVILARELACHWLPAAVFPPVKAIALDLDNTLHQGIVGEDGVNGVILTSAHAKFQSYVKLLQKKGVFIVLVSRNEYADVEELFTARQDYPLKWDDFSAIEVSWGGKAEAIERIARSLRISVDSVIFVDDNPGELAQVATRLPTVHTVYAHEDAELTREAVNFYPGLWRWKTESDDMKRIQDLKANDERESIAKSFVDPVEYFSGLAVTVRCFWDATEQLSRLANLCNKTNQFNLALRRFNHAELADRVARKDACVASVQLTDCLSDSGVIAVVVAERVGKQVKVEEVCVSCRALGRGLEDTIVLLALKGMPIFEGCEEVVFRVENGPRNKPALNWLTGLSGGKGLPGKTYSLPAQTLVNFIPPKGVTVTAELRSLDGS